MINIFEIPNMADILPEYKVHYQNIFCFMEYGDRENVQAMTDYSIMNGISPFVARVNHSGHRSGQGSGQG